MILVDSNVWIARFSAEDSLHRRSREDFGRIIEAGESTVISDHVISEVSTYFLYHQSREKAMEFLRCVMDNEQIRVHTLKPDEVREVSDSFTRSSKKLSFVDEIQRFLAARYGYRLLTYDKDLAKAK
jgi:predicted nucleic acid-binding protein